MSEDVCVLCGSPDRDKKSDHLRECYIDHRGGTLDRSMFCPRLFQDEKIILQSGSNHICHNRKKCRERQSQKKHTRDFLRKFANSYPPLLGE